jgi:hypothetical protein
MRLVWNSVIAWFGFQTINMSEAAIELRAFWTCLHGDGNTLQSFKAPSSGD